MYKSLARADDKSKMLLSSAVHVHSGSHDPDMILFKQFLYRVVQGALDPEESTLSVFGKDGDRDCAFPHRYNPFIDGPADDLGDCLADPGQFFGEQFFDGIEILETDAYLERIPGIHTGHIDDILDIPIADDLDVASGPFQLGRSHADLQHLSAVAAHIDNISDLVFSLKYNRQTGDDVRDQVPGTEGYISSNMAPISSLP